jgi:hypothetical protein
VIWILIGVQTYRNEDSQRGLQAQLNTIQKNTERPQLPPVVNVVTPPAAKALPPASNVSLPKVESTYQDATGRHSWLFPGKDVKANIFVTNAGPATADISKGAGMVYLMPSDAGRPVGQAELDKEVKMLIPRFKTFLAKVPVTQSPLSSGGQDFWWNTARSERVLTQDDIAKLASGEEILFLFFGLEYSDPRGSHYMHRCMIAQPPAFNPAEVWGYCNGFQDHK